MAIIIIRVGGTKMEIVISEAMISHGEAKRQAWRRGDVRCQSSTEAQRLKNIWSNENTLRDRKGQKRMLRELVGC